MRPRAGGWAETPGGAADPRAARQDRPDTTASGRESGSLDGRYMTCVALLPGGCEIRR